MAEEFCLRHHFEPSFPDAPPPRAPRDLRSKTRAPLVRLTPNFMGIHPTAPNDEWRKNFASGTILSRVFPDAPPPRAPRDLRSKTRAPLVRLTPNFMGIHPTAPNDEWRKNFASGTILSRVFPTPRPLSHPRLAQQNSRTPCPIDFKFYRPSFHHPLS
ncbi:hypothetical protein niasHT_012724 [Heterodera trifolii]|uniref:Uncharacterized protein n=1 Tax=Heterodera trifolii TaxID=157864 RepID=A0ABD2L7K4_9BILA